MAHEHRNIFYARLIMMLQDGFAHAHDERELAESAHHLTATRLLEPSRARNASFITMQGELIRIQCNRRRRLCLAECDACACRKPLEAQRRGL